jgi:serine/threonine protein kinase
MEFIPGGDLSMLIEKKDSGCLSENETRFYIAEIIAAVTELHSYNVVHR